MIKKFSLSLVKILVLITFVILGSVLFFPGQTQAATSEADYSHLTFYALDANQQTLTNVRFSIYEQLNDIAGQPVLGDKLGSGRIDSTGIDTIKIKNIDQMDYNIAILYYKNSRNYEKFTQWDEHIYGTSDHTFYLTFSSAKIIIVDKNHTLLKDQSFYVYSTGIDAQGNKVAYEKLYSSQKTGALGYKLYYFVPGDYAVKIAENDYFFTVNKNQETQVTVIYEAPAKYTPAAKVTATINLIAKDSQGSIVNKVNYAIYEQLKDANNNPVLGKKLSGGSIKDTGFKSVSIKNTVGTTLNLAVVYYSINNAYGKFYLYNQTVTGNETKEIRLPFAGARISIAEPNGSLQKNHSFDVHVILKDANGSQVGSKKVLSSQKTDDWGYNAFYLIPNDYFITIKNTKPSDPEVLNAKFTISNNQITAFRYYLGALNLNFKYASGDNKTRFKILKYRDGDYFSMGSFTTNEAGAKRIVLPAGEYKLDSKLAKDYQIIILPGNEKTYSFTQGTFTFRIVDGYRNPLSGLKVSVYKYTNSKQGLAFSETTNSNGEVSKPLDSGNYIAEITTLINNQKYSSRVFYVQNTYGANYEFVVSMVRVYLQDNHNNSLANQDFFLYNYATDNQGNVITGKELGSYKTNDFGYYDVNLLAGRYIVKPVSATKIFPILVETEKLNTYYLTAVINPDFIESTPPVAAQPIKTINTPAANTVYMVSIFTNNNLYNKDTDKDTLADFEEIYIWHTDPENHDTDGDGYWDNDEIPNGYNPLGPGRRTYILWAYEKPRVSDLKIEQKEAAYLKAELTRRLGFEPQLSSTNWNTLIKSFVYGGYTVDEIKHTVQYGPALVHPTIPAYKWRVMR